MTVEIRVSAATHVGNVRPRNEDAFGFTGAGVVQAAKHTIEHVVREQSFVAVLSDGVGGHPCGDRASAMVVEKVLAQAIAQGAPLPAAIEAAHQGLAEYSRLNTACSGLAATVAAVLVVEEMVVVANVGDSRVYVIEDGAPLTMLTFDDAPRGTGVPGFEAGGLTRTLGGLQLGRRTEPHIVSELATPGTRLLMCTDGLSSHVPGAEVAAQLRKRRGMDAVSALLDLALDAGGRDNVTIVLIEFAEFV